MVDPGMGGGGGTHETGFLEVERGLYDSSGCFWIRLGILNGSDFGNSWLDDSTNVRCG